MDMRIILFRSLNSYQLVQVPTELEVIQQLQGDKWNFVILLNGKVKMYFSHIEPTGITCEKYLLEYYTS